MWQQATAVYHGPPVGTYQTLFWYVPIKPQNSDRSRDEWKLLKLGQSSVRNNQRCIVGIRVR